MAVPSSEQTFVDELGVLGHALHDGLLVELGLVHPVDLPVLSQLRLDALAVEGVVAVEGVEDVREDVGRADVAALVEVEDVEAPGQVVALCLQRLGHPLVGQQLLVVAVDVLVVLRQLLLDQLLNPRSCSSTRRRSRPAVPARR